MQPWCAWRARSPGECPPPTHPPTPAGHPIAICTDDPTILNTSVSQELAIAAQAFGLSRRQLRQLALSAADHAFLPDDEKAELRRRLRAKMQDDSACQETSMVAAADERAAAASSGRPAVAVAAKGGQPAAAADAPAADAAQAEGGDGKAAGKSGRWRFWKSAVRVASS